MNQLIGINWEEILVNIINNHPETNCNDNLFSCTLCNGGFSRKGSHKRKELCRHILNNHSNVNNNFFIFYNLSPGTILRSNLNSLFYSSSRSQYESESKYHLQQLSFINNNNNVSFFVPIQQKENSNNYSNNYILKIIRALAKSKISILKFSELLKIIQYCFLGKRIIDTPSDTTIKRHVYAVSKTLNNIFIKIINENNISIPARYFDESGYYSVLLYTFTINITDERRIELENEINFLSNQNFVDNDKINEMRKK